MIKSAQALGIPAALCVASWDHLTTKGLIRVQPDLVSVWNEAAEGGSAGLSRHPSCLHRRDRCAAVRSLVRAPANAARGVLPEGRPAGGPADRAVRRVRRRRSRRPTPSCSSCGGGSRRCVRHPRLSDVSILVRPHPFNSRHWSEADVADLPNVAVYPHWANPVNEADRQDYFDSLYHSEAVVGHQHHGDDRGGDRRADGALGARRRVQGHAGRHAALPVSARRERRVPARRRQSVRTRARRSPRRSRHRRSGARRAPGSSARSCVRAESTCRRRRSWSTRSSDWRRARRARARMPLWLYPLRACLWLSGVVAYYPQRAVESGAQAVADRREADAQRPQTAQADSATHARTRSKGSDVPRRKVG